MGESGEMCVARQHQMVVWKMSGNHEQETSEGRGDRWMQGGAGI